MIVDDRIPTSLRLPFEWRQAQHMSVIGDTGTGKSTALALLLLRRKHQVVFKTKADDVKYPLHIHTQTHDIMRSPKAQRILLSPRRGLNRIENQRREISAAIEQVWQDQGRWCVCFDELFYACEKLKLEEEIDELLTQGRSEKITVVMGMQRPVSVTRFALSQSTHILCFRVEGRDLKTIIDTTSAQFARTVADLSDHELGWYHRPTRQFWRGYAQEWEVYKEPDTAA